MTKTTKWLLVGGAAVLVLYLVAAKSSPIKLGTSSATTNSGAAGILSAGADLVDSASGLIDTIWGDDGDGEA